MARPQSRCASRLPYHRAVSVHVRGQLEVTSEWEWRGATRHDTNRRGADSGEEEEEGASAAVLASIAVLRCCFFL